jgi:hypothetical protein
MMYDVIIGIDNGVSGSIGMIQPSSGEYTFNKTPVQSYQDYTKKKKNVNRVIPSEFIEIITKFPGRKFALIERPMINPRKFTATISAVRCMEAQLQLLESLNISYDFCDSKEWQKTLLPAGCKGEALKTASRDIGIRLFPEVEEIIRKQKDADGMLIAEYARRSRL